MANIYMRMDGVTVTGGATIEGLKGDGWIALTSYNWGAHRNVAMDIGNGNNADSGMSAMSEVVVTKECDGSSGSLLSYLFKPGNEGKTVEFVFTKPGTDGSGAAQYLQVKLTNARLVSYTINGNDGYQPHERIAFSYVEIYQRHDFELEGGEVKQGGIVTYNVPKGKLLSGA